MSENPNVLKGQISLNKIDIDEERWELVGRAVERLLNQQFFLNIHVKTKLVENERGTFLKFDAEMYSANYNDEYHKKLRNESIDPFVSWMYLQIQNGRLFSNMEEAKKEYDACIQ